MNGCEVKFRLQNSSMKFAQICTSVVQAEQPLLGYVGVWKTMKYYQC